MDELLIIQSYMKLFGEVFDIDMKLRFVLVLDEFNLLLIILYHGLDQVNF